MTERASQQKTNTNAGGAGGQRFSSSGNYLRRKCACESGGSGCDACQKNRKGELRRAALNPAESLSVPGIVDEVLDAPGRQLDSATRAFMEPRFGRDFSNVRVHTDSRAADSARAVNALAYTVGRDVVFGEGKYVPGTREGRSLLAHELTHVAQNGGARRSPSEPILIGPDGDRFEAEADARANATASGEQPAALEGAITPNSDSGRMSRATFQIGSAKIQVNYDDLGKMPAADYEKEIEKRFVSWTGGKASTIHGSVTKLSSIEKEFVLFGLDLLADNPITGLDKVQAVRLLIAHAPKASTRPLGNPKNEFEEEVLSVSGWFEKALTLGLSAPTGTSLATVQGLLGVSGPGGASETCPSPRKKEDQLDKGTFETELPKRLEAYLKKVVVAKTPVVQAMPPLLKAADEVQKQARKFYSPYADRSSGTGNTLLQRWHYSAHTISSQSPQATPSTEVRTAYIASRSRKVGDSGLFGEVHYDWRCPTDKKVLADLVTKMEKESTFQSLVDPILREKSYTAQDADPKFVVLNPQYDASTTKECDARWKTVRTMCHELMHVMVHQGFHNAEKGRQLLTEGFPEVLGHYLYKDIRSQAGSDAKLKGLMEDGISGAPCKTIPDSKIEYPPAGPNAETIRNEVGDSNFRSAFFLGQLSLVGIQPKRLDDRKENDPYEKEADDAAQSAMDSRPVSINRSAFSLNRSHLTNEAGRPLESTLRREMETRLGHDFARVRVHADANAADSAASIGALAYTVGRNIVFGAGQFAPETPAGRRLLAHELTHVIQQAGASRSPGPLAIADQSATEEQEARTIENTPGHLSRTSPASTGTVRVNRAPAGAAAAAKPKSREVIAIRLDHREAGGLGRFDTLLYKDCDMKVQFRMNFDFTGPWPDEGEKQEWQRRFISSVTEAWTSKFDMEATGKCETGCPRVKPFIAIYAPHTIPHVKVDVKYTTTSITSLSGVGVAHLDSLDLTPVKKGDITRRERRSEGVKKMVPAVHEFGHLIGRHDQYSADQKSCAAGYPMKGVMCFGNEVTKADYEPFANALNQMTGCKYNVVSKA